MASTYGSHYLRLESAGEGSKKTLNLFSHGTVWENKHVHVFVWFESFVYSVSTLFLHSFHLLTFHGSFVFTCLISFELV